MKFAEVERDLFEGFGDPEPRETTLDQIELAPIETKVIETKSLAAAIEAQPPLTAKKLKTGISWAALCGGLAAVTWVAGAIGLPLSYYGVDAVMAMDPALQAALIAGAFGPAMLFWLGGAAAGEAFKARRLASEITRMAQDSLLPMQAGEAHALRLSHTVKAEIQAINDAVADALARMGEFQAVAQKHAALFDSAVAATRDNADYLAGNLAREREALLELNGDLRGQTETMAHSIGRQVRMMREASKLVKTEIGAAEDALQTHVGAFANAASALAERTAAIHGAADSTHAAVASLNGTMTTVLDGLGQATQLTDAARQSAAQAALAANETASAVRETTRSAVMEAKRAAQAIRAETIALQESAAETLSRLQQAAQAARAASEESQAAADRHAVSIEKRLTALAATANTARKPVAQPVRPAAPVEAPVEQRVAQRFATVKQASIRADADAFETEGLYVAAAAAVSRGGRTASRAEPIAAPAPAPQQPRVFKGLGGWNNIFPPHTRDDVAPPKPANNDEPDAFAFADFGTQQEDLDADLKSDALDLIAASGVDLHDALTPGDLDRIAQRSRQGATARRQAVMDFAPSAVTRVARHLNRSATAAHIAKEFRARPDLATNEQRGESATLVRAYLLIDAALA